MFVEDEKREKRGEENRNSIKSIFKSDTLGGNSCDDIVLWGRITIAIKVIIITMMMVVVRNFKGRCWGTG